MHLGVRQLLPPSIRLKEKGEKLKKVIAKYSLRRSQNNTILIFHKVK